MLVNNRVYCPEGIDLEGISTRFYQNNMGGNDCPSVIFKVKYFYFAFVK